MEPLPDVVIEELQATLDSVFARVQRSERTLPRSPFMQKFYAKSGAPAVAYAMSTWAERMISPVLQSLVQRIMPQDDPLLVEL